MRLSERINYFEGLFAELMYTTSLTEKRFIVDNIPLPYKDDFEYIIQVLAGERIFGYTYYVTEFASTTMYIPETWTVRELLEYLRSPYKDHCFTRDYIHSFVSATALYADFLEPIVNRSLRLGIGRSLLTKESYAPMLAKKYEGKVKSADRYYITEKLDGNRCIAKYCEDGWKFYSRNGKLMSVNFDMRGLPTCYIYDGEVLSREQTVSSATRTIDILEHNSVEHFIAQGSFNATSGAINRRELSTNLVYNIFDIIDSSASYQERREELDTLRPESPLVRILPVLRIYESGIDTDINGLLEAVVATGGEGLMINLSNRFYENKRTDSLLKFKQSYTVDLIVDGIIEGSGKYEGMVGALSCHAALEDGSKIICDVGSGLSDSDRLNFWLHRESIVGKVIEVEYFSKSQSATLVGTRTYSLRFPRFKRVRYDKICTSEF